MTFVPKTIVPGVRMRKRRRRKRTTMTPAVAMAARPKVSKVSRKLCRARAMLAAMTECIEMLNSGSGPATPSDPPLPPRHHSPRKSF